MTQFVHLHLHTQYTLLDGANRLDDVLAARGRCRPAGDGDHRPRQHVRRGRVLQRQEGGGEADHRLRGLRARRASRLEPASPTPAPTTTSSCWPRTRPATRTWSSSSAPVHRGLLLQAAHRQGAPRQAQRGADRPLLLPQRRGLAELAGGNEGEGGRGRRPHVQGDPRRGNFFLEIQDHGIPTSRRSPTT